MSLGQAVNLDGEGEDRRARAQGFAEPLPDGRMLLCCASSAPIRLSAEESGWLYMPGCDLTLLHTRRAPLLISHGHDLESLVGVVDHAWIEGDQLYAVARTATTARGREVLTLVQDRVLANVSIGLHCRVVPELDGTGADRIHWWRPYEVSLITVPGNWDARTVGLAMPLRVRRMLADAAAASASGTPASWRAWADAAAGPLAAHAGLNAVALETALIAAVEAELRRLASEAAQAMQESLQATCTRSFTPEPGTCP